MKKIYSFLSILFVTGALTAQVNVTYMVDITNYLAAGNTLGAGGIRIGGDFAATGGMNGATAMAAWTPSDPTCALTDMGSNVWSITVTYPTSSIGMTQPYKFVNNDWGTNEGTDAATTIATDGCGTDDGGGNINRTLLIPDADVMLQYCWDACFKCDGSAPEVLGVENVNAISGVVVSPNPVSTNATISFNLTTGAEVSVSIMNMMGQEVLTVANANEVAGNHAYSIDVTSLPAGNYVFRVIAGDAVTSGNIVKL
ncbi:MAG: T9SS type A sorting domain-containing protein [Bacteroidetes bacterium]|nr:T9SS type A sorting domain-containing protein [Bacteroidota bacterium]